MTAQDCITEGEGEVWDKSRGCSAEAVHWPMTTALGTQVHMLLARG